MLGEPWRWKTVDNFFVIWPVYGVLLHERTFLTSINTVYRTRFYDWKIISQRVVMPVIPSSVNELLIEKELKYGEHF